MMHAPMPRMRPSTDLSMYVQAIADIIRPASTVGIAAFERDMAMRLGVKEAVAMPMARVAIYLAVKALVKPGDEVILSPYTISDVVNMVVCAGAVPVFADIDRATCNIDPLAVERLITPRTGAVLCTHFYGLACDMTHLRDICDRHGLPLIEDAAQAFGCRVDGRPVGTLGHAGIFSFGLQKNVTCFIGGMLVTDDVALANRLRQEVAKMRLLESVALLKKVVTGALRDLATWPPLFKTLVYRVFRWAYLNDIGHINSRLAIDVNPTLKTTVPEHYLQSLRPFQGEIILRRMAGLDADTASRIQAAQRYHEILEGMPGLILPPLRLDGSHIYHYYPVQHDKREELARALTRAGRDVQVSHHRNCAALPCFKEWGRDCPNAEQTARTLIYLPTYPSYGMEDVARTAQAVRACDIR